MAKRRLYSEIFYKEIASATVDYAEGEEVPQGYVLYVTAANFEDENNLASDMCFGKKQSSDFIPFECFRQSVLGVRVSIGSTHVIIAGWKPAIRIRGAIAADKVRGYAEGYYTKIEEV